MTFKRKPTSGECIYEVPGQNDRTRIDTGKGERLSCCEAEAEASAGGWRRSKV